MFRPQWPAFQHLGRLHRLARLVNPRLAGDLRQAVHLAQPVNRGRAADRDRAAAMVMGTGMGMATEMGTLARMAADMEMLVGTVPLAEGMAEVVAEMAATPTMATTTATTTDMVTWAKGVSNGRGLVRNEEFTFSRPDGWGKYGCWVVGHIRS